MRKNSALLFLVCSSTVFASPSSTEKHTIRLPRHLMMRVVFIPEGKSLEEARQIMREKGRIVLQSVVAGSGGRVLVPVGQRVMVALVWDDLASGPIDLSPLDVFGPKQVEALALDTLEVSAAEIERLKRHTKLKSLEIRSLRRYRPGDLDPVQSLKSLEEIEVKGAGVKDADLRFPPRMVKDYSLTGQVNAGDIEYIRSLNQLREMSFSKGSNVTDDHLIAFQNKPKLKVVRWGDSRNLSGIGLSAVDPIPSVREVWLRKSHVTNAGLKQIARVFPNAELLLLSECESVTDEGLEYISQMPRLKKLYLDRGPKIDGRGFKFLRDLKDLEYINIDGLKIDASRIEPLIHLPSLRRLDLNDVDTGDEALMALRKSRSLRRVDLLGNDTTTVGGIEAFLKGRPTSYVAHGGTLHYLDGEGKYTSGQPRPSDIRRLGLDSTK